MRLRPSERRSSEPPDEHPVPDRWTYPSDTPLLPDEGMPSLVGKRSALIPSIVREAMSSVAVQRKAKVFGYVRFSTEGQNYRSIERQIAAIEAYALRHGLVIDEIFKDEAVSGTSSTRRGLDQLFAACELHPGSIVIVENIDRLLRSMPEYARILLHNNRSGTKIHDSAGHNSPVMEAMKAGFAAEDRSRLVARTVSGKMAAAREGRWIGSIVPFGYRRAGRARIEIDPETAKVVRLIFELAAAGLSYRKIAKELEQRGIASPKGGPWKHPTLSYILSNPVYTGWCVWHIAQPQGVF